MRPITTDVACSMVRVSDGGGQLVWVQGIMY